MARPKLPPAERRSEMLPPVRLTTADYRRLVAEAKAAGTTLSDYVRARLLMPPPARRRTR